MLTSYGSLKYRGLYLREILNAILKDFLVAISFFHSIIIYTHTKKEMEQIVFSKEKVEVVLQLY